MKAKPIVLIAITLCLSLCGTVLAQDSKAEATASDATTASDAVGNSAAADEVIPSIIFDETPLTDVITTLARQAEINFVFAPDVTAPQLAPDGTELPPASVSIRFENVTAANALSAILENHNLELIPNSKTGIARIVVKDPNRLEPLITKIIQLEHASPTNVLTAIEATISERGKVVPDFRTSQVVVIATETEFENINELIAKLDVATPQVLIEARIMETSVNPTSIKGIDWSGTLQAQNFTFGNGITTGTSTSSSGGTSSSTSTTPTGSITSSSTGGSTRNNAYTSTLGDPQLFGVQPLGITANMMGGFSPQTAFLNADGVRGVLSFLNTDSDTRVVATPRTVTLDNHTARLEVARAFPIFEITPGAANTPGGAEITYTNLGTIIEVTPRISANSNIHLSVIPEVSNIDSQDTQVINGTDNVANVYAIRRMETQVIIPNGNTLVMGGLMTDNQTTANTKVPVLGDMPGLGLLFRRDQKIVEKVNLIIFITPTIVEEYDFQYTPSDYLRNSVQPGDMPKTWQEPGEPELSPWDRGKPMSWGRSKK